MTKKVFVLIASAIVCLNATAQVQFGFKVGIDATNFWGQTDINVIYSDNYYPTIVNHEMQLKYQVGLMMEYKFSPKFAIAPEVVFATQGGKCTFENPTLTLSQQMETRTTNYINVPLMLKYYLSPAFSIDLGPQVGFNVYSKMKIGSGDYKYNIKTGTNTVDFGIGMGGTYNLTDNAFIQTRYTMGLTKVFKTESNNAKNSNIQLAFGLKF